ncbi:hypothetical protein, partial [uncultured Fibrobacter sp.]|uniref:hypothetical protein n=1 Tax=uncultured Fibrobacter sp. TaxID=261512 RepID=UPI002804D60F
KLKMYQFLAPNGATGIDVQKFPCPKAFIYRGASVAHGNLFRIYWTRQFKIRQGRFPLPRQDEKGKRDGCDG